MNIFGHSRLIPKKSKRKTKLGRESSWWKIEVFFDWSERGGGEGKFGVDPSWNMYLYGWLWGGYVFPPRQVQYKSHLFCFWVTKLGSEGKGGPEGEQCDSNTQNSPSIHKQDFLLLRRKLPWFYSLLPIYSLFPLLFLGDNTVLTPPTP